MEAVHPVISNYWNFVKEIAQTTYESYLVASPMHKMMIYPKVGGIIDDL